MDIDVRFQLLPDEDLAKLSEKSENANTRKSTNTWIKKESMSFITVKALNYNAIDKNYFSLMFQYRVIKLC